MVGRPSENGERSKVHEFADFSLDLGTATLRRGERTIPLRPKTYDVLRYMVEHQGELVSKNALIDEVWHGAAIGDDSIRQCVGEIRKALNDRSRKLIRTVPRRGFVFEPPESSPLRGPENTDVARTSRSRRNLAGLVILACLGLLFVVITIVGLRDNVESNASIQYPEGNAGGDSASATPTLAVAVLPFEDQSATSDQQFIADGFVEEVSNALMRSPDFNVIDWNSVHLANRMSADYRSLSERLNSRYLLAGSVAMSGDSLRITARLIDGETANRLWSDSFSRTINSNNLHDVQGAVAYDIATRAAEAVGVRTPTRFSQHRLPESSLSTEAQLSFLRGMYYLRQMQVMGKLPEGVFEKARANLENTIVEAPEYADAYFALGTAYSFHATRQPFDKEQREALFDTTSYYLERAIELDPNHAMAYAMRAFVRHVWRLDFDGAAKDYQRAMSLGGDVHRGLVHWGLAIFLLHTAQFEASVDHFTEASRLDPLNQGLILQRAHAMACALQFEESIAQWEQIYSDFPETARGALVALYALTGQLEKSEQIMHGGADTEPNVYSKMTLLAVSGRREEAEELIETVTSQGDFNVYPVAGALVELGEKQRALDYLEAAVKSNPKSMLDIQCWYRPLADEPRFQRLLDEIGFPSWARVRQ